MSASLRAKVAGLTATQRQDFMERLSTLIEELERPDIKGARSMKRMSELFNLPLVVVSGPGTPGFSAGIAECGRESFYTAIVYERTGEAADGKERAEAMVVAVNERDEMEAETAQLRLDAKGMARTLAAIVDMADWDEDSLCSEEENNKRRRLLLEEIKLKAQESLSRIDAAMLYKTNNEPPF